MMRLSFLLAALLVTTGMAGCVVPENMTALKEELGYASVDLPDLIVKLRPETLEPRVDRPTKLTAELQGVPVANASFTWALGDGTTAHGQSVEHTYEAPGRVPVNVSVETTDGVSASDQVILEVLENTAPVARITVEDRDELVDGDTMVLSAVGSQDADGDALTHTWTVGDADPMEGARVEVPVAAGVHKVTLTTSDGFTETTAQERVAVDLPAEASGQVSALSPNLELPLTVVGGLGELTAELTHSTTLGADDVRLVLKDSDGQAVAESQSEPSAGSDQATESLAVAGGDLEPGSYTLAAEHVQGGEADVTLTGFLDYTAD